MYAAFLLACDKTLLCLPLSRCAHLDLVRCCNYGVNRNMKRRVFYSPDKYKEPNFKLPLSNTFENNRDGCYIAYCLKFFDSVSDASKFIEKQRRKYPAVYNDRNLKEIAPPAFTVPPPDVKELLRAETKPLREAILYANNLIGVQDLTDDDVTELGDVLTFAVDSDVEELQPDQFEDEDEDDEMIQYISSIVEARNNMPSTSGISNNVQTLTKAANQKDTSSTDGDSDGESYYSFVRNKNTNTSDNHSQISQNTSDTVSMIKSRGNESKEVFSDNDKSVDSVRSKSTCSPENSDQIPRKTKVIWSNITKESNDDINAVDSTMDNAHQVQELTTTTNHDENSSDGKSGSSASDDEAPANFGRNKSTNQTDIDANSVVSTLSKHCDSEPQELAAIEGNDTGGVNANGLNKHPLRQSNVLDVVSPLKSAPEKQSAPIEGNDTGGVNAKGLNKQPLRQSNVLNVEAPQKSALEKQTAAVDGDDIGGGNAKAANVSAADFNEKSCEQFKDPMSQSNSASAKLTQKRPSEKENCFGTNEEPPTKRGKTMESRDKVYPNATFEVLVNGARLYTEYGVTLRMHACAFIQMYNTDEVFFAEKFDDLFLRSVLIEVFRRENIMLGRIDEKKMEFVRLLFEFHTKGNRLEAFGPKTKKILRELFDKFKLESQNSMNTIMQSF